MTPRRGRRAVGIVPTAFFMADTSLLTIRTIYDTLMNVSGMGRNYETGNSAL